MFLDKKANTDSAMEVLQWVVRIGAYFAMALVVGVVMSIVR